MAGSYRKIDYRVRPAKSIERKMLADGIRRLAEFERLDSYRYIGFGSLYFTDFILFHKALGFKLMQSIENEQDIIKQERFRYNVPYKCINMAFGASSAILPTLPWDVKSVIWLDYDGALTKGVLEDIAYVVSKAVSGSMLLVSVNAGIPRSEDEENTNPLDILKSQIGAEKIPADINARDLSGWNVAKVYRDIIDNEIADTVATVNRGRSIGCKCNYNQLFNFHYEDGVKMLTVGGIIYDEGDEKILAKCSFDQLEFYKDAKDAYKIDPPLLTYQEMRKIDSLIPLDDHDYLKIPVPRADINKYQNFYRYFPHFAETEIR